MGRDWCNSIKYMRNNRIREEIKNMFGMRKEIDRLNQRNVELARQVRDLNFANKDLRFENEEQNELITRIRSLVSCNKYNNEKAILDKIKELVRHPNQN